MFRWLIFNTLEVDILDLNNVVLFEQLSMFRLKISFVSKSNR